MKKGLTFGHCGLVTFALVLCLGAGMPRNAQALTMVLDWTTTSTDIFGQTTGAFDATPWSAIAPTAAGVQSAALAAVTDHYLGYPTMVANALSPLAAGRELDINFVNGTVGTPASNGDTDYWYFKIGDGISGAYATDPFTFGYACLDCVRDAGGVANKYGIPEPSIVGSVWGDHLEAFFGAAGAVDATTYLNLLVGTISHEIGHALALGHTSPNNALAANPGASAWGVMGSGATAMPIGQRVLEREFTYDNFDTLIDSVGVRDVTSAQVPVPSTLLLMVAGMLLMSRRSRVSKAA